MAEGKLSMFGKAYNTYGSSDANLIFKTKGDVKIQYGGKFITLIQNGKIAVGDSTELFHVSSTSEFKKNGVYLVDTPAEESSEEGASEQSVYLYFDGVSVLLASSSEGFISYTAEQKLTAIQSLQALLNIGFYFQTLQEAKDSGMKDGIVYILEENKLYQAQDGEFTNYFLAAQSAATAENPEEPEEEKTKDTLQVGMILIDGVGGSVSSSGPLLLAANGTTLISLGTDIKLMANTVLSKGARFTSESAIEGKDGSGLSIYTDEEGKVHIETDYLLSRNKEDSSSYMPDSYSEYISSDISDVIATASWVNPSEPSESETDDKSDDADGTVSVVATDTPEDIELTLRYGTVLAVGDIIAIYLSSSIDCEIVESELGSDAPEGDESEVPMNATLMLKFSALPTTPTEIKFNINLVKKDNAEESTLTKTVTVPNDQDQIVLSDLDSSIKWSTDYYVESIEVEQVSGDKNISYKSELLSSGAVVKKTSPILAYGTVTSDSPIQIHVPESTLPNNSVLENLVGTTLVKVTADGEEGEIVRVKNGQTTLETASPDGAGSVTSEVHTKLGDLSDVTVPDCSGGAGKTLEGRGIYSDNANFVKPKFLGKCGDEYPEYDETLTIPEDIADASLDNCIPNLAWIKKLVEKMIKEGTEGGS